MILIELLQEYPALAFIVLAALIFMPAVVFLVVLTALTIASMLGGPVATAMLVAIFTVWIILGILKWLGSTFLEMIDKNTPKPPKKDTDKWKKRRQLIREGKAVTMSQELANMDYTVSDIVTGRWSINPITRYHDQQHDKWKAGRM